MQWLICGCTIDQDAILTKNLTEWCLGVTSTNRPRPAYSGGPIDTVYNEQHVLPAPKEEDEGVVHA